MKKIFLSIMVTAVLSITALAQKVTLAVSAGISYANVFLKADSNKVEGLGSKNGFTGGISANIPISKYFSFQPAVNFLQKGAKIQSGSPLFINGTSTITLNYIEVPLNLMFNTDHRAIDKKADDFFFGIGPSFAFGASGEIKEKDAKDSVITTKIKFGSSDNDNIKGVDIGANVVIGCMFFNNAFFSVNYNIGFNNLLNSNEIRWHNNYLGFKVGYSFGNRK